MDNMIRRPSNKRPQGPQTPPREPQAPVRTSVPEIPVTPPVVNTEAPTTSVSSKRKKRPLLWILGALLVLIIATITTGLLWYNQQLQPVDKGDESRKVVEVVSGSTPDAIADQLKEEGLIRDAGAFAIYTRLAGVQNNLLAGTYRLSPSESLAEIVEHLTKGNVDTFSITFIPGKTLADHKKVLIDAGYEAGEIDEAFMATYEGSLFEGRPTGSDIEGYIFPETYQINSGASVKDVLQVTFDQFEKVIAENNLRAGFAAHDLNLYEGITLASIIQRETIGGDEAQISQVFHKRLAEGMPLGSDPTYQYAADKEGRERSTTLDSPYNTRIHQGLTPTPIASPGIKSLQAAAQPAEGDYLYFLSGDDDVTYFAHTLEEHEANIRTHCKVKCQII